MLEDLFLLESIPQGLYSSNDMIFNAGNGINHELESTSMDLDDLHYLHLSSPMIDRFYTVNLDQNELTNDLQNTFEENSDIANMKLSNENTNSLQGKQRNKKLKRGKNLPSELKNLLKVWIYQNWMNPYPSKDMKERIADKYGVSQKQLSTYLVNARMRLLQDIEFQHKHCIGRVKNSQQQKCAIPNLLN
ncbi:hypothetical protein TVAG_343680 [Trichomonas vaginalis G3]|uniref:Homeobox domain-containing protein n=1 Tax=Trichomonas vaginalis (strain ATCC PRA-98 / G3) TaxID=412133 RepID=A2E1H2_TRIV3|nr:homeobox-containing family [Trichomonas vaginalis G3]EAY13539.1 hypothetical protein TVAG_343680 [Trichomonas vaginalis G3]KAI5529185.1 homeobox-containing family [Trichomonas vaginalis G3]|eukprot:XP_001325762.1 hypothetical protein [Trichomonas vaginalis G3]